MMLRERIRELLRTFHHSEPHALDELAEIIANTCCESSERSARKDHDAVDRVVARFIIETGKVPSQSTVLDLIEWSYAQVKGT